jgi:hypothetical protein
MTDRQGFEMPPLGTKTVDPIGASIVEQWIRGLDRCQ